MTVRVDIYFADERQIALAKELTQPDIEVKHVREMQYGFGGAEVVEYIALAISSGVTGNLAYDLIKRNISILMKRIPAEAPGVVKVVVNGVVIQVSQQKDIDHLLAVVEAELRQK